MKCSVDMECSVKPIAKRAILQLYLSEGALALRGNRFVAKWNIEAKWNGHGVF